MQKTSVKLSSAVKNKIKINMAEFGISVLFSNLCIVSSSEIQYLFRGFDRFHNLILSISRHGNPACYNRCCLQAVQCSAF